MGKAARVFGLSLLWLVVFDIAVAVVLSARISALEPLWRYFYVGNSVPTRLALWQDETQKLHDNLFHVGWISDVIDRSTGEFAAENPGQEPAIRSYGMSFVNHILDATEEAAPDLVVDRHSGPGAPPNWTYAAFLDDRANRKPGDVVILGVLSASVPGMEAMSNRTFGFEQPAPLTYPIFRPEGATGLRRIDPLITTQDGERALATDPDAAAAWAAQLAAEDSLYTSAAFALPELDVSPFVRLVRRGIAVNAIEDAKVKVVKDDLHWSETLRRISMEFARIAREDGQVPIIMLIQGRQRGRPDLLELLGPELDAAGIPYMATAQVADPSDPAHFLPDGHYKKSVNRDFAAEFLNLPGVRDALN